MGKSRPADPGPQPQALASRMETTVLQYGPLPPAEEFRRYGEALPGAAERIMVMAEREQAAHLEMATRAQQQHFALQEWALRAQTWLRALGQVLGCVVIGATLWVARDLLMADRSISGMAALIAALAALVGLFVYRQRNGGKR